MKSYKALKNTLLSLAIICVLVFAVLCGVTIVQRLISKKPVVTILGYSTVTIAKGAGSMVPTLYPGDKILLKKCKEYGVGDVITYNDGNGVTTHRIVEVTADGYVTAGDYTRSHDTAVKTTDDIVGKMVSDGAMGGFKRLMLSQWGVLLIAVVFCAGYFAMSSLAPYKD